MCALTCSSFSIPARAAGAPPTIISYQGRLTDGSGNLLGDLGTTYYLKFSIWDSPTVGAGNRVWPTTTSVATTSVTVTQGLFTVNIGDTANGYPTALNLNVANNTQLYLQVEVSADNNSSETLSPRQQLTSSVFSLLSSAVVGTTTPSLFGTTTPIGSSFITAQATSATSIPLTLAGTSGQTANLFQVLNNSLSNLFSISSNGTVTFATLTSGLHAASPSGAVYSAATSSLSLSGPFSGFASLGALVGGSNSTITWTGLATTSQPSSSNLLVSNGGAGVYGVATSTLTASSPLTGSFTVLGSGGSLGCQTANGSQAGCLSSADWTTFNSKSSFAYPFNIAGNATSTLTQFNGGLTAYASTTIGNGGQGSGLTINGGATTTGNAYVNGNLTVGTTGALVASAGNIVHQVGNFQFYNSTIVVPSGASIIPSNNIRTFTFYGNPTYSTGNGLDFTAGDPGNAVTVSASTNYGSPDMNVSIAFLPKGAGNIGIATSSPFAKLSVAGSAYIGGNLTATGTLAVAGISTFSSNIGVGTTSPWKMLSVGTGTTGTFVIATSTAGCAQFSAFGELYSTGSNCGGGSLTGTTGQIPWFSGTNTAVGTSSLFLNSSTGNFGIGTTSPLAKLDVFGNVTLSGSSRYLNFGATSTAGIGSTGYGLRDNAGVLEFKNSGGSWQGVSSVATSGPAFSVDKNGTDQTISTATYTPLTWSHEIFDTNNNFDTGTGRFTPTVPGKYLIKLNVYCGAVSSCYAGIAKNGSALANIVSQTGSQGNVTIATAVAIVDMNGTTDYIVGDGYSDVSTTIVGTVINTNFSGALIAPVSAGTVNGTGSNGQITFWNSANSATGDADFVWDSTNSRLGIGTSSPWAKLSVVTDATTGPGSVVDASSITDGVGLRLEFNSSTMTTNGRVFSIVDKAFNSTFFEVNENGQTGIRTFGNLGSNFSSLTVATGFDSFTGISVRANSGSQTGNLQEWQDSSGNPLVVVDPTGKVGVGTSTPHWNLQVAGTRPSFALSDTSAGTNLKHWVFSSMGGNLYIGTSTDAFGTSSPAVFSISSTGSTTAANGININNGCFAIKGACIGYTVKLAAVYATSTAGTNATVQFTGAPGSAPSFATGAPGTLTLPSNTSYIVVETRGGGGGGGNNGSTSAIKAAGGGGQGGYSRALIKAPTGTYKYTVGLGGAGGTGTGAVTGTAGGASCFGTNATACTSSSVQAAGGSGGVGTNSAGAISGGAGGSSAAVGTVGDYEEDGAPGGDSSAATNGIQSGAGGGQGGGLGRTTSGNGNPGINGGGGSGGLLTAAAATQETGGKGGDGVLIISVYATSSANATGNDYAEMFPVSDSSISSGDIVAVDNTTPVSMRMARGGEHASLAGIVSTAPGQILGDASAPGQKPIAFSGRVPTKVNLENGPIHVGDRIAPSFVAGVGKKAGPLDDSVGIALEAYDGTSDSNQILVFLDLHQGIDISSLAGQLFSSEVLQNISSSLPIDSTSTSASMLMGTTSPETGTDFVGAIFGAIIARMQNFGIFITKTATHITTLMVSHFTVGSSDAPEGITIYDRQGRAGCLIADDVTTGKMQLLEGMCGTQTASVGNATLQDGGGNDNDTGTSTPAVEPIGQNSSDTATSTSSDIGAGSDEPATPDTPSDTGNSDMASSTDTGV
ncbi:MAG TPA: hypothetical protein VG984_01805 [Candidatus Paceibacterota bacterium]|nr:hypothetical protein [Candidatus Paceibacterota bacterium]